MNKAGGTKQLVIDAARKVFARLGVSRTTMNDIAEASNKGRRTLYTYFKSKEDVYQAVVEQELNLLTIRLEALMEKDLAPDQKLIEFIFTHLSTIDEIIRHNGTLRADFFSDIKEIQQVRRNVDIQELRMLRRLIKEGVDAGLFGGIENIEMASILIFSSLQGLEVPYTKGYVSAKMKRRKEQIARFILKGLS